GTYSPESLYLGGFELEHGRTRLSLRATLGTAGIQAGGIELRGPRGRLGGGEFYLPINALKLLETGSLAASVIADKTLHLRIETSEPVALETLFGLAGRDAPAEGLLSARIEAGGPPGSVEGHGKTSIQNLRSGGSGLKPSALALEAKVGNGRLAAEGELRTGRALAARVTGDWPLRLGGGEQGGDSPGDPGDFHVAAQVPGLELSLLRPLFPGLTKLRGRLHGTLEGGATNGAPSWHGRLSWRDAGLETGGPAAFEISGLSGELIAQGSEIALESCGGFVNSGPFRLGGRLSLDGWPQWQAQGEFEARGARLPLPAVDDLRADVDLRFEGGPGLGLASGEVRLVEGRLSKRIEIVPQLAPGWGEGATSFQAPDFSKFLLPGLEDWALDVRVRSAKPGSLSGGPSGGEIEPSLRLAGSLAKPVPEGVIEASNLRAFLPFTTLHIPRARAEFFLEDPWMPHLDAQGIAEVMDYDVDLRAQGRLADRVLYMRSEPPLPRESLLLLLTTGYIARDLSSQSFAGAIARQPGAGALQQLAKQLGLRGWEAGSLTSLAAALQPSPLLPAGQQPLRARLRLWQGSGAEAGQDEPGAWNIQAGYRYRFR
ncbi:MAG: translocation/assembly module TamB domain-containing protein, partial [Terrimicrobiaceae bacterium]|nr:translocation/assembly module TamB domain-containing protein [Terrimicrobiaceae bacterium]